MVIQLLNSATDGNTVYSSLKNSNSYRDVYDLNGSDVLTINTAPTQPDSMFNYVDALKQGTMTPEQIGKFHNLGLDFLMNYPDFNKFNTKTQSRVAASIIRHIGVVNNNLPFEDIYEKVAEKTSKIINKYLPGIISNPSFEFQKMCADGILNTLQLPYLNAAYNILEANKLNPNSYNLLNVNAIKTQFNNLISVVKNDRNLSNEQSFDLAATLSIMKYSAEYWNNYSISLTKPTLSSGSSGRGGGHSSDSAIHQAIACCGPGIPFPCSNAYPCNYYGGGNGGNGGGYTPCQLCEYAHVNTIIAIDGLGYLFNVLDAVWEFISTVSYDIVGIGVFFSNIKIVNAFKSSTQIINDLCPMCA